MLPTIAREVDAIVMIDQRKLPKEEIYVRCRTAPEVARAIKTMVIRGAPAIGVAAAMGIALGIRNSRVTGTQKLAADQAQLMADQSGGIYLRRVNRRALIAVLGGADIASRTAGLSTS